MKTRLTILKLTIVLCSTVATTTLFGQTLYTWSGTNGGDIGLAANWTPSGQPSGANQDTAQWDGVVAGNLSLVYATGWPSTGYGTEGVNLVLTANQVGNVTITAPSSGNSPAAGIFGITNNSATATFHLGESSTARQLMFATRPGTAGTVHGFVNNSTNAAIMDSSVNWVAGGGVACVMDFGGTGDWIVNHNLRDNNSGAAPITVVWEGPGTMSWSPGGVWLASDAIGPITNNSGTIILKGAGLCPTFSSGVPAGNNSIILNNAAVLKYDAVGIQDNISRLISGTGTLQVNNGSLTLSGPNTYTGNTVLSGGELIVGVAENLGTSGPLGVGGTISFSGGTLGFSGVNTYDYSPRFSTAANQAFSFDTAGLSALFTNNISSSGGTLTKLGSGTLTLSGTCSYSGLTTVSAGTLWLQGSKTGSGNITVNNSTILAVTENGSQMTPATLTVGTSGSAELDFWNVTSTTTAPIAAGTVSVPTGNPINIFIKGGLFTINQSYPLITWSSGTPPGVNLSQLVGAVGNLSTNGNTIQLNVTSLAFVWTGLNNANWDTNTPNNWKVNGVPQVFADGGSAVLDDTVPSANTNVTLNSRVAPLSVTVSSSSKTYSITSSGTKLMSGTGGLTKNGNSTLTLSGGANNYSGVTTFGGGTVSFGALANGGAASDIGAANNSAANLVFNGGGLQYTGSGASIDRLFTLGTGGGTIDSSGSGSLNLNNSGPVALSGTGARVLTLTGSDTDATLAAALSDSSPGATSLVKNGAGTWVLTGTNSQTGVTTINNGTLQIGTGGATSSPGSGDIVDNSALDFNVSGTLTVGTISGSGSVTNDGSGTLILPGNNSYAAGTTINSGTVQVGTGGAAGQLNAIANIANNGTLIFNSTSDSTISGVISGTGQLIKRGSGLLKFIGANTYTGTTTIDAGAQLQLWQGNTGANASSAITNNGTLIMMRQDNGVAIYAGPISGTGKLEVEVSNGNGGDSTFTGTNTYTGGTYILGGGLIIGDNGITPYGGSIVGNVFLTNDYIHATFAAFVPAILTFNRAEDFTFPGNIVGDGTVTQTGSGTVTLTGNNTYTNGTTINIGTLQVGAGGTSGSVGTGTVTDNGVLVFNRSDNMTITNVISGGGSVVKLGSGTVTLITNSYSGTTTVSNGTLVVNGDNYAASTYVAAGTLGGIGTFYGPVTLDPGTTLAPGASIGTLTINSDLSIGGNLAIEVNKSLSPSSDLVVVSGMLTNTGTGTLTVANLGPALAVGDKFTLFSQAVSNGVAITVTGGGANWANNLAVDGSITVSSLIAPPTLNYTRTGNSLQFSWTGSFKLQAQTNSISLGISTNWANYPGGGTSPVTVPIVSTNGSVFFRLVSTP